MTNKAKKQLDQKRILVINLKDDRVIDDFHELQYCLELCRGVNMIFNKFTQFELILFQMVAKQYPEKIKGHFQNFCFKEVDHLAMALLSAKPCYAQPVDTIHMVLNSDIKIEVQQFY